MLQPVWVFAISSVGGSSGWLYVGCIQGFWAHCGEECRGVKGASTDLHIVGLEKHASLLGPVGLETQDQILKVHDFPLLTQK